MDLLLPLLLMGLLIVFVSKISKESSEENERQKFNEITKLCPPHHWSYKKQSDVPEATYIQCDRCKMLPKIDD